MTNELAVEVRALTKRFRAGYRKSRVAVDRLSFEVGRGKIFGLLGPNGAGKTTTIRAVLGLIRPTEGDCLVLGEDVRQSVSRVGVVMDSSPFLGDLRASRHLEILSRMRRGVGHDAQTVLSQLGLLSRADDFVKSYSAGMKQRFALAAALLKRPELLILDEPANALDPEGLIEVREGLRRYASLGGTVLLSTHLLAEAEVLCDELAVISRGQCVWRGPTATLKARHVDGDYVVQCRADDAEAVLLMAGLSVRREADGLIVRGATSGEDISRALARRGIFPEVIKPHKPGLESAYLELIADTARDV